MKILLLESNEVVRETIPTALEGMALVRIASEDEIHHLLAEETFDAFISNSIPILKAARTEIPALPLLFISATRSNCEEAEKQGLKVLPKPFEWEELRRMIQALTSRP